MRTNIIQILIIAFVLILGWTLFTVYQDLDNSAKGKYNAELIFNKGRQYLPLGVNFDTSGSRNLPKYVKPKGKSNNDSHRKQSYNTSGGSLFSSSTFDISNKHNAVNVGVSEENPGFTSGRSANSNNSKNAYPALAVAPFAKKLKIKTERNLALNANQTETSSDLFSDGTRYKAFGDPGDVEDVLEGGGGDENEEFYNDMPVGDGLWILIVLAVLYLGLKIPFVRFFKNL